MLCGRMTMVTVLRRTRSCFCSLLLLTTPLLASVAAQSVQLSVLNFRPEPVQIHWLDNSNSQEDAAEVPLGDSMQPYEVSRHTTHVGHVFVYYLDDMRTTITVTSEKEQLHVIPASARPVEDTSSRSRSDRSSPSATSPHSSDTIPVTCTTTQGDLHIAVRPSWSPHGAARFLELVAKQYYDGCALHRVVSGFLTQFGISADDRLRTDYRVRPIPDDVVRPDVLPFQPGYLSYAGSGTNSRTTQIFVVQPNVHVRQLDAFGRTNPWETPFGYVEQEAEVTDVVGQWYAAYGDMPPYGQGPDPHRINQEHGYTEYLAKEFPNLSYIQSCRIIPSSVQLERGEDTEEL